MPKSNRGSVLFRPISRAALTWFAVSILTVAALSSASAYLYSMTRWALHREIAFEGDFIRVPSPWVAGESGHLFSVQRPALTIFSEPSESTIAIDNFGEHWRSDTLDAASDRWLKLHGRPISETGTAGKTQVPLGLKCVSPDLNASGRIYVRVDCLSLDSAHSYEYFGSTQDIPSFFDIATQAVMIGNKHPGKVFRP